MGSSKTRMAVTRLYHTETTTKIWLWDMFFHQNLPNHSNLNIKPHAKCPWGEKNQTRTHNQSISDRGHRLSQRAQRGTEGARAETHHAGVNSGQRVNHSCLRFSCACGGLPNESNMAELGLNVECVSTNQRETGAGRCTLCSSTLTFSPFSFCLALRNDDWWWQSSVLHQECLALEPSHSLTEAHFCHTPTCRTFTAPWL